MTPPTTPETAHYLVASRGETPGHGLVSVGVAEEVVGTRLLAPADQLSCIALHPTRRVVYATAGRGTPGRLLAWRLDDDATTVLTDVPSADDELEPCHVAVDPRARYVAVANYTSSEIALWRVDRHGRPTGPPVRVPLVGSGPDPQRQEAAHPHQIHLVDGGERMVVTDLGADLIREFAVQFDGDVMSSVDEIAVTRVPAGTGPRHLVWLADGRVAVSGELTSTLLVGRLGGGWHVLESTRERGVVTGRTNRNYPGDIALSPGGEYVYLANRGYDTVSIFDVRAEVPVLLTEIHATVAWPQHLLVEPDRLLVAGWDTSAIARFTLVDGLPRDVRHLPVDSPGWILRASL